MSDPQPPRQPKGVKTGGQYAASARNEAERVSLSSTPEPASLNYYALADRLYSEFPLTREEVEVFADSDHELEAMGLGETVGLPDGTDVSIEAADTPNAVVGDIVETGSYVVVDREAGTRLVYPFRHLAGRANASNVIANQAVVNRRNQPQTAEPEHPIFGKVIHSYTRAQALADGVLIDHTDLAREAGISWPVALTAAAQTDAVTWPEKNNGLQDETGRAWDVMNMCRHALAQQGARNVTPGVRIAFQVMRVPNTPRATQPRLTTLHAVIGPDDTGKPCITLMTPEES